MTRISSYRHARYHLEQQYGEKLLPTKFKNTKSGYYFEQVIQNLKSTLV